MHTSGRSSVWPGRALVLAGALTLPVAIFHAVAIFVPTVSEPSPPWRHGVFVLVNLFFAWAFLTRARWLPLPFGALCIQQAWSHGSAFLAARAVGHTDLQSLAVLVTLPCLLPIVWLGRKPAPDRATADDAQ